MRIIRLKAGDSPAAAKLHLQTIPDITATLGSEYVERLYGIFFSRPETSVWGITINTKLAGLAVISTDQTVTEKEIHNLFNPRTLLRILMKIVSGKITFMRIINRWLFENSVRSIHQSRSLSIITFCIGSNYRRRGLGKKLMAHIIKQTSNKRVNKVFVDSQRNNKQAIEFYRKCGFKIVLKRYGAVFLEYNLI